MMVGVQVLTDVRLYASRAHALLTETLIFAFHAIHISRRTAEVGDITFEIFHLKDLLHLSHDRLLAARCDELALMRRYGTKRASAEASAMNIHRMTNHFVSRNYAAFRIFRMRQSSVRQVERSVDLRFRHRRIRRINI